MSIWTLIAERISVLGDSVSQFLQRMASAPATPPERTVAFSIGMIALSAKMAKADGVVTENEIAAFKQVFHVPDSELSAVARVFNLAKKDVAGFDIYAAQMAKLFTRGSPVLEDVLDGLFHIAKADGAYHPGEHGFLSQVAEAFGFAPADFARIQARHIAGKNDPFLVLGIDRSATIDQIKAHYRALVRENHPDRHIAAGVPQEMIDLATERLQIINEAYDRIVAERVA